jgi:hypothetical protein
VRAFFEAAVAAGAEVLHGPRAWPEYHPGYYGAFVRDPGRQQRRSSLPRPEQRVPSPAGYAGHEPSTSPIHICRVVRGQAGLEVARSF